MNKYELAEKILKNIEEHRDLKVMNFYAPLTLQLDLLKEKGFTGKDLKLIKYRKKADNYVNYYYVIAKILEKTDKMLKAETYLGERNFKDYKLLDLIPSQN